MSTLFVQYNSNCPEFANLPLFSKVLVFYICGVIVPLIVFLPKKSEVVEFDTENGERVIREDTTIYSISASLRTRAARISALSSLAYWAITDLVFCSTWKGFYAMEVTGFVLIFLVIFINAEYVKNPTTDEEKFQRGMAIAHMVVAAITFVYLEVLGALIVANNLTGSVAFEATIFSLQSFFLLYLMYTRRKYDDWVNATDLAEYLYVTFSLVLIGAIQRATIVQ